MDRWTTKSIRIIKIWAMQRALVSKTRFWPTLHFDNRCFGNADALSRNTILHSKKLNRAIPKHKEEDDEEEENEDKNFNEEVII